MNHKVLLADDSQTIQKVIKITLANQPYDIIDCSTEEELFKNLPTHLPKLVFLDFNLSEKFTGYELTAKIKSLSPTTKVLLLLGTFDTVDDGAMEKCGASDKIVKPFDSNKFIAICKQLIDTFAEEELPYPENNGLDSLESDNSDDQWTVGHTTEQKFPEVKSPVTVDHSLPKIDNPLAKEMSDWGMSVPNVINDLSSDEDLMELPPVIGEDKPINKQRSAKEMTKYEQKFPQTDDLDYPTIEETKPASIDTSKDKRPMSKLISIDSFNEKAMELEIEGSYVPDESDVNSIEAQIHDEVADNLWQADEFEDLKKEVSSKIEEVKNNFQPSRNAFDESLFKPLDDNESIDWIEPQDAFKSSAKEPFAQDQSVDMSELKSQMEEMVKSYVKEYLDEMFQKNTEKVAWEVIPDLAENLIRQELSKIANKIISDQN